MAEPTCSLALSSGMISVIPWILTAIFSSPCITESASCSASTDTAAYALPALPRRTLHSSVTAGSLSTRHTTVVTGSVVMNSMLSAGVFGTKTAPNRPSEHWNISPSPLLEDTPAVTRSSSVIGSIAVMMPQRSMPGSSAHAAPTAASDSPATTLNTHARIPNPPMCFSVA